MRRFARLLVVGAVVLAATLPAARSVTAQMRRDPTDAGGRIVGRIVDAATGQPIPGARIEVVGSEIRAYSGADGRYTLVRVPEGTHAVTVTFLGYATETVGGIRVVAGRVVQQDVALTPAVLDLDRITVSVARDRGSVTAALEQQRTAAAVIDVTTSEQIARSPDGDAAQAVKRMSGVTVRDGRYVIVRGVGERYTTTALNGVRVPSPDPEKKVVPLDLFPSGLLETITTSKTFTPDQPGDFSGAQVDLRTRSFPGRRTVQVSLSTSLNALVIGRDVPVPFTSGGESLALAAARRALPAELMAIEDFSRLTQAEINDLIRKLPRNWRFRRSTGFPGVSGSLSFGGEEAIAGRRLGYTGSLTYSRSHGLREDEVSARAVPADTFGTPAPYNVFRGSTGVTSVLWGGLLDLGVELDRDTKLYFRNTYSRAAENEAREDWGTLEEYQQVDSVRRTMLRYVEHTVRSNQLGGEHRLGSRGRAEWSVASSSVRRVEPDRADLAYGYEFAPDGERLPLAWLGFIAESAKRTTSRLAEDAIELNGAYRLAFGPVERESGVKVGAAFRRTRRDARTVSYTLRALGGLGPSQRAAPPEELFYGSHTEGDAARITLEPNSAGGTYSATDRVAAGFVLGDLAVGSRLRLVAGARVERWALDMEVEPTSRGVIRIERRNTDVLPSLALNIRLSRDQMLRLSASQTLARPEYRELAPVSYRDMLGSREVFGDSSLVRTLVRNVDVRWEWYPGHDEVISAAAFAKHFDKPIEPIDVATSGASQLSFINARSAFNYGIEVDVRKNAGFVTESLRNVTLFANVTITESRIDTGNSTLSALTKRERPMVGHAPYVVNAGLTWAGDEVAASATMLYNVVGPRLVSAAVAPVRVDTYERPRHQLDVSVRFPIGRGLSGKLDVTNLLDSVHEERQGDVIRYRYRTGRTLALGLRWGLR